MKKISFVITVVFTLICLAGCTAFPNSSQDIRYRIADAYGLKDFNQVTAIRYTFNARIGEKEIHRSWIWWPRSDRVRYIPENGKPMEYRRSAIRSTSPDEVKKTDQWFVNDQYWLLFPFHLVWDDMATVVQTGTARLPIGDGQGRRIVVTYPAEGGYTPGDVYELFVGSDFRLMQWIYRKGGADTPTRMSTWEDHRRIGPITLCLNHQGADESFAVWFTEVAVQSVASDRWYSPEQIVRK